MSALPVQYSQRAIDDLRAVSPELRPAVLEHLSRIATNHTSCSRPSVFPRPPGLESGLWCRHSAGGATLVEVLFLLTTDPDGLTVRRVILTATARLPGWVTDPTEWTDQPPWPVVDI